MTYLEKHNGPIGKIHLNKFPYPFGIVKDLNGVSWHLNGQIDKYILAAKLNEVDEYWSSTNYVKSGVHEQTWKPHEIVVSK